jgi:hypothetical protein
MYFHVNDSVDGTGMTVMAVTPHAVYARRGRDAPVTVKFADAPCEFAAGNVGIDLNGTPFARLDAYDTYERGKMAGALNYVASRCPAMPKKPVAGVASPADPSEDADAGSQPSDAGNQPADSGSLPSDAGNQPGDSGSLPSDAGNQPGDSGSQPSDAGNQPGDSGNLLLDAARQPSPKPEWSEIYGRPFWEEIPQLLQVDETVYRKLHDGGSHADGFQVESQHVEPFHGK